MNERSRIVMEQSSQMTNRCYGGGWPPLPAQRPCFGVQRPSRANWKGNRNELRRRDIVGVGGQRTPLKTWRSYPKKNFNSRFAPFAPRNTTSYIIRAKKSGGITSLISPCPVTPAILPTPILSPLSEVLVETAKEKWGVDGYGSMKGLIRLRSLLGQEAGDQEVEGAGDCSSEECVDVERRIDHDLSRFEMIYPNGDQRKVDEEEEDEWRLEEGNLTLKERLWLMESELKELRRRVEYLETDCRQGGGGGGGGHGLPHDDSNASETNNAGSETRPVTGDGGGF